MRTVIGVIVSAVMVVSLAGTADASRTVPGFPYKDECNNIVGVQTIVDTIGSGPYRKNLSTPDPNDCYRIIKPGK